MGDAPHRFLLWYLTNVSIFIKILRNFKPIPLQLLLNCWHRGKTHQKPQCACFHPPKNIDVRCVSFFLNPKLDCRLMCVNLFLLLY